MSKSSNPLIVDFGESTAQEEPSSQRLVQRRYSAANSHKNIIQFSPITIDDVEEVAAFELEAKAKLDEQSKDYFFNHNADWFAEQLEQGAHIVSARNMAENGKLVGKANLYIRKGHEEIYDEGVPPELIEQYSLDEGAFLGGAVVLPQYGGFDLHKRMMDIRLAALREMPVEHAFSVTNIENYPSGSNLLASGFKIRGYMSDPRDGAKIYCYHTPNTSKLATAFNDASDRYLDNKYRISGGKVALSAFYRTNYKTADFDDDVLALKLLQQGYVGVGRISYDQDNERPGQILFAHPDEFPEID